MAIDELQMSQKKGMGIPVSSRGDLQAGEASRLPHFLKIWLTDGDKVISPTP
jgi:hypothetical protein